MSDNNGKKFVGKLVDLGSDGFYYHGYGQHPANFLLGKIDISNKEQVDDLLECVKLVARGGEVDITALTDRIADNASNHMGTTHESNEKDNKNNDITISTRAVTNSPENSCVPKEQQSQQVFTESIINVAKKRVGGEAQIIPKGGQSQVERHDNRLVNNLATESLVEREFVIPDTVKFDFRVGGGTGNIELLKEVYMFSKRNKSSLAKPIDAVREYVKEHNKKMDEKKLALDTDDYSTDAGKEINNFMRCTKGEFNDIKDENLRKDAIKKEGYRQIFKERLTIADESALRQDYAKCLKATQERNRGREYR